MDNKKALGLRIRELRKIKKISQERLAELVELEPPSICNIENGKNYPAFQNLEKIINVLGVSFADVFQYEHLKKDDDLIGEINALLKSRPDRVQDVYKIVKTLCE